MNVPKVVAEVMSERESASIEDIKILKRHIENLKKKLRVALCTTLLSIKNIFVVYT